MGVLEIGEEGEGGGEVVVVGAGAVGEEAGPVVEGGGGGGGCGVVGEVGGEDEEGEGGDEGDGGEEGEEGGLDEGAGAML